MLLGIHQSLSNPMSNIPIVMEDIGATTFQIFLRNNRNCNRRQISPAEIMYYNAECLVRELSTYVVHAPYIMNLCDEAQHDRAVSILQSDFDLMTHLCCTGRMVIHPGSHKGLNTRDALENVVKALRRLKTVDKKGIIAVETMAGAGTQVLSDYKQVELFLALCYEAGLRNVGLCLDTCHLYGAGIDFEEFYQRYKDDISVIHLNGSECDFGSRKDRHASIRDSKISADYLVYFAKEVVKQSPDIPIILETPASVQVADLLYLKKCLEESAY